jgi:hypothetical protein
MWVPWAFCGSACVELHSRLRTQSAVWIRSYYCFCYYCVIVVVMIIVFVKVIIISSSIVVIIMLLLLSSSSSLITGPPPYLSSIPRAGAILSCPLWFHRIFRHYLINSTIFGKKSRNIKCVIWFSLQLLFETFLSLRRIQRDTVINVKTSSCKVPVIFVWFQWNLNFLNTFPEKTQISNFIKTCRVGAELFHADRQTDIQTDRHDVANYRSSQCRERA